ncbi:MAG: hypothetical protein HY671_13300 [Chloroflexi bacterium]|nr:hypothetical protein [Chloroflexota bacterium]
MMRHLLKMAFLSVIAALSVFASLGGSLAQAQPAPPTAHVNGVIAAIDKAASPPTVTIHPKEGADVTVKIVEKTMITKAGLGDLAVNDRVTATYDAATLEAARLVVAGPVVKRLNFSGTVKSLGSDSFVLATKSQGDVTIKVDARTQFVLYGDKDDKNGKLSDLKVGNQVAATVADTKDGNLALRVRLLPIHISGQVKSVDLAGKSFVLTTRNTGDITIKVNSKTRFQLYTGNDARLDDLKVGSRVTASVVETSEGNVALQVKLLPIPVSGQIKGLDQSSKSFVLTTKDKGDVTIKVDSKTQFHLYRGEDAKFQDLEVGNRVTAWVVETTDGNLAVRVRLLPIAISGQIKSTDQSAKSFVLTTKDKTDVTINTDAKTQFLLHSGQPGKFEDLKVGNRVTAAAVETSDGILALRVRLLPTPVSGQIKSIDLAAKSFVVTTKDKTDVAIKTDTNTKFLFYNSQTAKFEDLKVGNRVTTAIVETADGNLAVRVRVLPIAVSGQVKSLDRTAKSFVLTTQDRGDVTIKVNDQTRFQIPGEKNAKFQDIEVGNGVTATVVATTDGDLALVVRLPVAPVSGQIKSIDKNEKSFVLTTQDKGDVTINVDSKTSFQISGEKNAKLKDLKVGDSVVARTVQTSSGPLALLVRLISVQ